MEAGQGRSRKRRRIESSEEAIEGPTPVKTTALSRTKPIESMNVAPPTVLTNIFDDFRSIISCKICFRLLYEPYTISCGHTYCYSCLSEWFDRNEDRRKTCPDCRAVVRQAPAPAYTVREITQKYIQHPECLPEGETTEQHQQLQAQETQIVENHRNNAEEGGLFKGVFINTGRGMPPPAIYDEDDGVDRCPFCTWELEPEDGPVCPHCGREHDADSDEADGLFADEETRGWPLVHALEEEEELDEDDMYDAALHTHLDPDLDAFHHHGPEAYYVRSGDEDDASITEVVAPPRRRQRSLLQQRREARNHEENRRRLEAGLEPYEFHSSSDNSDSESETEPPRRAVASRRPIRIEDSGSSDPDSEGEGDSLDGMGPALMEDMRRVIDRHHRQYEEEQEESEEESEGSLRDFLDDEASIEDERVATHHGDHYVETNTDSEETGPSDASLEEESDSGSDESALPDLSREQRRLYQEAMRRDRNVERADGTIRWGDEPGVESSDEDDDEDEGGPPRARIRRHR